MVITIYDFQKSFQNEIKAIGRNIRCNHINLLSICVSSTVCSLQQLFDKRPCRQYTMVGESIVGVGDVPYDLFSYELKTRKKNTQKNKEY